jgi:hypothetical protein
MDPVDVDEGLLVHHARRRRILVAAVAAVLTAAGIAVALVAGAGPQATCPAAASPLGGFASQPQLPRLCELGAASRLIGSGRVDGVRWRMVATPPRPWPIYNAAGFGLPANMSGRDGSCLVEVVSRPAGYFNDGCMQWSPLGPVNAGHFLASSCDRQVIVICYASLQQHAEHFVLLLARGGRLTLNSVSFHGRSFAAFALPAGQSATSLAAYDSRGRRLAGTDSLLRG